MTQPPPPPHGGRPVPPSPQGGSVPQSPQGGGPVPPSPQGGRPVPPPPHGGQRVPAYAHGGQQMPSPPPQGGFSSAPAATRSKAPVVLIVVGVVILLLSVIIGVVMAFMGLGDAMSTIDEMDVLEGGSGTITAESGEVLQLYVEAGAMAPACHVVGPSPDSVGEGTFQTSSVSTGQAAWESFDSFTAEDAGEYTIDCAGTTVGVAPPVSIGSIFSGVIGILLAIGGGMLGFLLLAIGVLLLILRRRRG